MEAFLKEAGPLLPGYSWERDTNRYRDGETGRFVSRSSIVGLLSQQTQANEEALRAGVSAFREGLISEATFLVRSGSLLREQYLQNAALAAGGWDRLGPKEWGRIGGRLGHEYAYLRGFAQEISEGKVSELQALNRMDMYAGGARAQFFQVERERLPRPEPGIITIERRRLAPVKHCPECIEYHEQGWQLAGVLPLPTQACSCSGNCRCRLERKDVTQAVVAGWVGSKNGPGDEMEAAGFAEVWDEGLHPRDESGKFTDGGGGGGRPGEQTVTSDSWLVHDNSTTKAVAEQEGLESYMRGVAERIAEGHALESEAVLLVMGRWGVTSCYGPTQRAAVQVFDTAPSKDGKWQQRLIPAASGDEEREVAQAKGILEAMYADTQAALRGAAVEEVQLFRGVHLETPEQYAVGSDVDVATNPLSSWTSSIEDARPFGSITLSMIVPAARVLSLPSTGLGSPLEQEVVVIGGENDRARVIRNGARWQA